MAKMTSKKPTTSTTKKSNKAAKAPVKKVAVKKTSASTKPAVAKKVTATTKKIAPKAAVKAAPKSAVKTAPAKVEVQKPVATAPRPMMHQQRQAPRAAHAIGQRPVLVNKHAMKPSTTPGPKRQYGVNEYVVYPTHGVGKIMAIETETIGDHQLKVFVIAFEKDKMILRVPVGRAEAAGLRGISSGDQITRAISTLKGRAKIARGMWSRRAQEYESKINSGNLIAIAEVVRDLHKNVDTSERSYSERMIYETAFHRLVGEYAAAEKMAVKDAHDKLLKLLRKQVAAQAAA